MILKVACILICFLTLFAVAFSEVYDNIPSNFDKRVNAIDGIGYPLQNYLTGYNQTNQSKFEGTFNSGDDSKYFGSNSTFENGIHSAGTNNAKFDQISNRGALIMGGGSTKPLPLPNGGYGGNSYTINFYNINYGELFEQHKQNRIGESNADSRYEAIQKTLAQLAQRAKVHEMELKENLELLKSIAS
jgi:hypothetical protein